MNNKDFDNQNSEFWSELCGTAIARDLGVSDDSKKSIELFDDYFFKFYPYLNKYVPYELFKGKKILEIGLGYGSVGEKLFNSGAEYNAVDISNGPIEFIQHRADLSNKKINTKNASAIELPFESETFDAVISIGCLHHTGDLKKSMAEVDRVLKIGGSIHIMLYSSHSWRQLISSPRLWLKELLASKNNYYERNISEIQRANYDANSANLAAPHVSLSSHSDIKNFVTNFEIQKIASENGDLQTFFVRWISRFYKYVLRKELSYKDRISLGLRLRKIVCPIMNFKGVGTDIYLIAKKVSNA